METYHARSVADLIGDGIDHATVEAIARRLHLGRDKPKRGMRLDKIEIGKIEIEWRLRRTSYH